MSQHSDTPLSAEKRLRHVSIRVFHCVAQTGWSSSALIFTDQSGDIAPRKVTLKIDSPSDISYIRERLQNIEDAWRKEIETAKFP